MDLSTIRGVLLDMDGTLVDSDAAVERAWRTWAGEHDVDPEAVLAIAHGSPAESTIRRLLPELDDAAVATSAGRLLALEYDDLSDVGPTRGADELLATLRRLELPWAVVTSADPSLAKVRLAAAGIDPPVLLTLGDVSAGKPDPEGYRRGAELLDVPVARCLVVEDTEIGLRAGRAAGAMTAALKGCDGDLRVDDLGQLARLLAAAPGRSAPDGPPAR
ncbi:HAD-IA family hydrolase [Micromonospora sp. NPDC049559]|uniref:HAD-IA family hydrolase n=1 Tax=Micromonospora sp. NPDC049559 TaxID=3155923 RepID=UPI0034379131